MPRARAVHHDFLTHEFSDARSSALEGRKDARAALNSLDETLREAGSNFGAGVELLDPQGKRLAQHRLRDP
jgi:hypothetical protein